MREEELLPGYLYLSLCVEVTRFQRSTKSTTYSPRHLQQCNPQLQQTRMPGNICSM